MTDYCEILKQAKNIAVVGLSANPVRQSRQIAELLLRNGYNVVGVNPLNKNDTLFKIYPSLRDVPFPIDIVDVFRRSEHIPQIIDDVLAVKPKVLWLQAGIRNDEAVEPVIKAGITTIQDFCIKVAFFSCF